MVHLDYCYGILYGIQLQIRAAKVVLDVPNRKFFLSHNAMKERYWLPTQNPFKIKILLFLYKCIEGLVPKYLSEMMIQEKICSLRNNNGGHLYVPYGKIHKHHAHSVLLNQNCGMNTSEVNYQLTRKHLRKNSKCTFSTKPLIRQE